jgi:hypothetical protein
MKTKIGSLKPISRRLMALTKALYDTDENFLKKIAARESWRSSRYEQLLLIAGTRLSVRETSSLIEVMFGLNNNFLPTTARNRLKRYGAEIVANMSGKAKETLNQEDV